MTPDVIKEFLVGLGFGVDDSSLAKFNKAIASATLRVTALYAASKAMATAVVYGISKISEGFEQLGYEYRIIAPAINKALILRRELLKAYSAAGINITKVVQASVRLNFSLAKTKFALEAIYKSVGSRFFELLTKQSDIFRKRLYDNLPRIQNFLERLVQSVFHFVDALTQFGSRVFSILGRIYDFLVGLDRVTGGWSTAILAVAAAWRILNLAFLATPLGLIITGITALIALWDDLQVFREGGKSLFNWSKAIPVIDAIGKAIGYVVDKTAQLVDYLSKLSIFSAIAGVGEAVASFLLGPNVAANAGAGGTAQGFLAAPMVGSNVTNNNGTNQNVTQQTNINVQGVADAGAVGKAVSSEQSRVNFDMVRNLKGATR